VLTFAREDVPLYLVAAAAVTTVLSITVFEVLMGLALLAMLLLRRPWRPPPNWPPLALFLVGTLISLAACGHLREGIPQVRKFYVYLMLFLVAGTFRNTRQIRLLAMAWSLAATLSAAWAIRQFIQKSQYARLTNQPFYTYYVDRRVTGFMDHWMTLGGEMMIVLLAIAALVFFAVDRRWIALPMAAALPVAIALEQTWTRSMWLGALCGTVYLIWCWKRWALLLLPAVAALVLLANPFEIRQRAASAFFPHESDSNAHRVELRRIGWQMIAAHPWLGIGPDQVSRQIANYLPPGMTGLRPGEYYGHLENDYIQYAAERGVPTMLALMAMIALAVFHFSRGLRRLPPGAEERWVLHAAIAVTAGVLVGGFYSWNLNNSNVLAMFLTVLGCGYVALAQAEAHAAGTLLKVAPRTNSDDNLPARESVR